MMRTLLLFQAGSKHKGQLTSVLKFDRLKSLNIEQYQQWISSNIRGQDHAVLTLIKKIQRNLFLAAPQRNLGTYLLVGPTGTGKTFITKLISHALFPHSRHVLIPMNEYSVVSSNQVSVIQLLVTEIKENPYRVIVFDELEKAHPKVRQMLYQVLDTGEAVDPGTGRKGELFRMCVFCHLQ